MRANIWLLRFISIVRWFLLVMPVIIIFYQSNGLSLFEVFSIQAFFSLCVLLFEVPTGYIGDRFGWNFSLILGAYFAVFSMFLLMISFHYGMFLIAEFFMALSYCLFSGSDSALLYETLVDLNREQDYLAEEGMLLACGYVSEGVAAIVGGVLAYISIRLPFVSNFFALLLLIPLSYFLLQPSNHQSLARPGLAMEGKRYLRNDFSKIINFVRSEPLIKWVAIYSGFSGFLALASAWLMQSYFKLTGFEIYYIGIIWALLNFSRSLAAGWVGVINYRIGTIRLFFFAPLIMGGCALFMGLYVSLGAMIVGLLIQAMRGLQLPLVFTIINNRTSSDVRAAVLSLEGMMMRLFFVFFGPLLGLLSDYESIHIAFYAIAALALVGGLLIFYKFQHFFHARNVSAADPAL